MGTAIKQPVMPDWVKLSFVIFDIRALTLSPERQSARMSKITNDGLTRSDTGWFIAVPILQQWASKGWAVFVCRISGLRVLMPRKRLAMTSMSKLYVST